MEKDELTHEISSSYAPGLKQGLIYGRTVAVSWTGAVLQKPLAIQKCDGPTDRWMDGPTQQGVESRGRD